MMGYYGNGYGPMMYGGHDGFGFIFMLLIVVLVVALLMGLIHWLSGLSTHHGSKPYNKPYNMGQNRQARLDETLHILEKRFAQGEIDEEEFLKRRRILKEGG
ncbi:MAG: SHOCT domain-containing protein [Halothiobacillus sp.]